MPPATKSLDAVFQALGNPTRRRVVERLARGPRTVSDLAAPFDMALPSFLQHLGVLESSGVVRTKKRGRVRTVELAPRRLAAAGRWLDAQRALWERRLDPLDALLRSLPDAP